MGIGEFRGATNNAEIYGGAIVLTANRQFRKDHFTNTQNSPLGRSGDVNAVNALLFYKKPDDRYGIGVSCRNCFDDAYIVTSLDFLTTPGFNFFNVCTAEPGTWLLTFKTKFS